MTGDFHRNTVYHDRAFHAYMDSLFGYTWRNWHFRQVRAFAKSYNFGKLYGMMSKDMKRVMIEEGLKADLRINQLSEWLERAKKGTQTGRLSCTESNLKER